MVSQTSNRYQNFEIFMQLIACFVKKFATPRGACKTQNTVVGGKSHILGHYTHN